MPIYSRFVVKKKEKKEKKGKKKFILANKLEARLHWARSPVSGFSREKRGIEKKITKETSTKEGRNLHALQAVSTETTRSVSSPSALILPPPPFARRVATNPDALSTSGHHGMRRNSAGAASDEINFI